MTEVPTETSGDDAANVQGDDVAVEPKTDETAQPSPPTEGAAPATEGEAAEPDAAAPAPTEEEEAAHAEFLQTYQPVITRLPQALADERAEQTAAEEAERERLVQEQAERDDIERRKLEAEDAQRAEEAAYRDEHYPGT